MNGRQEELVLRSATGLEGGLVARGSTCGVVTGGALGIALVRAKSADGTARRAIMGEARAYVDWFQSSFGTTLCRERSSADFYKVGGQLRYLLPGGVGRCFWHAGKAVGYLNSLGAAPSPVAGTASRRDSGSIHCAAKVLEGVRASCGVGDDLLQDISFVLDGGVALSGGLCGAMAGAVMAVNLVFGWDIRRMSFPGTVREFLRGHVNLLRKRAPDNPETFSIGRDMMMRLLNGGAGLECSRIIGRNFSGWDDFQDHMHSSGSCRTLVDESVGAAVQAITRHRRLEAR